MTDIRIEQETFRAAWDGAAIRVDWITCPSCYFPSGFTTSPMGIANRLSGDHDTSSRDFSPETLEWLRQVIRQWLEQVRSGCEY